MRSEKCFAIMTSLIHFLWKRFSKSTLLNIPANESNWKPSNGNEFFNFQVEINVVVVMMIMVVVEVMKLKIKNSPQKLSTYLKEFFWYFNYFWYFLSWSFIHFFTSSIIIRSFFCCSLNRSNKSFTVNKWSPTKCKLFVPLDCIFWFFWGIQSCGTKCGWSPPKNMVKMKFSQMDC